MNSFYFRSKFKGDKTLDGYQKKKYVCKLLFIFLLGHDIDFGHMEAVNLLSSNKYTEKQIVSHFTSKTVVNFINVLHANFTYKGLFGSFFYLHVTREKLPKRLCMKNSRVKR